MSGVQDASARAAREAAMMRLFPTARIKTTTGMDLSYEDGCAVFHQAYNPDFDHGIGGIHGGLIMTLLDNAAWFTAAPHYDHWVATAELSVRILEPVTGEDLVARGRLVRAGRRLAVAEGEVRTAAGRLIATAAGTFAVTSVPLDV
jgi:uncharacterized protein (TIGR00369 family)